MTSSCRVCGKTSSAPIFSASIFSSPVSYYECGRCGYVQTEQPYWLEKAYASAINSCDTGIMARNQANVGVILATLAAMGKLNGCVVDCAAGYGILVRLLRDQGVAALWSDPYCKNLLAVGFEHQKEKADLVTAFEAFEHFVDPLEEAEKLFSIGGNLLFSTELIVKSVPQPHEWWYYGLDHGQHIGFYRIETLEYIARRFRKKLLTDRRCLHYIGDDSISGEKWKINKRLARHWPSIFTRRLKSLTITDFKKMSEIQ